MVNHFHHEPNPYKQQKIGRFSFMRLTCQTLILLKPRYYDSIKLQSSLKYFELRFHFNICSYMYLQKSVLPGNFSLKLPLSLKRRVALNQESQPAKCREGADGHEDRQILCV